MKLSVVGTGYVGLVSGACFADLGNEVYCIDIDEKKIEGLKQGVMPIYEPGLKEIVDRNYARGNLKFTTSLEEGVANSDIIFIAVGTPSQPDGGADLSAVEAVAKGIAETAKGYKIVVNKSTVPVGTGDWVEKVIEQNKVHDFDFDVVSCPEFLREGSAVADTMNPDRIVIGANNDEAAEVLKELHKPFNAPMVVTDRYSAEMIKYAANAFLATKISFINEIANICELTGADVDEVARGIGLDKRIGEKFLEAGVGYGGACFPKDTRAIVKTAQEHNYHFKIVSAVVQVNQLQKETLVRKLKRELPDLNGRTIALLGLAFKPNTDDTREAPSRVVIKQLEEAGARVKVYDPVIKKENAKDLPGGIEFAKDVYDAISGADAVILVTEWDEFKELDLARVKKLLNYPLFIDGRNVYDREEMKELGFTYYPVGKKPVNAGMIKVQEEVAIANESN